MPNKSKIEKQNGVHDSVRQDALKHKNQKNFLKITLVPTGWITNKYKEWIFSKFWKLNNSKIEKFLKGSDKIHFLCLLVVHPLGTSMIF